MTDSQNIDQDMLRSAQPSQFSTYSTYPSQYIDTPGMAVLFKFEGSLSNRCIHHELLVSCLNVYQSNINQENKLD